MGPVMVDDGGVTRIAVELPLLGGPVAWASVHDLAARHGLRLVGPRVHTPLGTIAGTAAGAALVAAGVAPSAMVGVATAVADHDAMGPRVR